MAKGDGAVAREAGLGFGSKPAGIRPTIRGGALIECGVAVFDQLKQGIGKIAFLSDPTTGEVRIGCVPSLAASQQKRAGDGRRGSNSPVMNRLLRRSLDPR
jgi:hypothetical protein